MQIPRSLSRHVLPVVVLLGVASSACSLSGGAQRDDDTEAPKTPAAVFEAQTELYDALFEDPPDVDSAVLLMSASCREKFDDAKEVVGVVLAEVELAQSADIDKESILGIFSEISYVIENDVASGDDGSEWVYENGGWRSTDC